MIRRFTREALDRFMLMLESKTFIILFLTIIYAPLVFYLFNLLIPASRWLEIASVKVSDTIFGKSPAVVIEREVHHSFSGVRLVSLRKLDDDGYELYCVRETNIDFREQTPSPTHTDLDWWLDVPENPPCPPLEPGRYVASFVWTIIVPGLAPKTVRVDSNQFEVTR